MQADHQQQPWKLNIQAKANNFHFKLKTNKLLLPSFKLFQFSIKFKIQSLLIRVKSQPQSKFNSLKSKFLQSIKKLHIRRSNGSINSRKWFTITRTKGSNKGDRSYLAGGFSRLCELISRKDGSGIIKCGTIFMMVCASRLNSYLRKKRFSLLIVLLIGMLISGIVSPKKNMFVIAIGYISSYLSMAKVIVPLLEFISKFI